MKGAILAINVLLVDAGETFMPPVAILEQAVLENLKEVLGSEASIERRLSRSRKSGKWSANLAKAVSNLHQKAAQVEQLLSILEQQSLS
jgi:hypothetical protein